MAQFFLAAWISRLLGAFLAVPLKSLEGYVGLQVFF